MPLSTPNNTNSIPPRNTTPREASDTIGGFGVGVLCTQVQKLSQPTKPRRKASCASKPPRSRSSRAHPSSASDIAQRHSSKTRRDEMTLLKVTSRCTVAKRPVSISFAILHSEPGGGFAGDSPRRNAFRRLRLRCVVQYQGRWLVWMWK